jgi:hypothetical protein
VTVEVWESLTIQVTPDTPIAACAAVTSCSWTLHELRRYTACFSEWSLGGIDLPLDDFDRIGSHGPLLVDLQPTGRFLMDDFYRAGGLLAVLREVRDLLDPTAVPSPGVHSSTT